MSIAVLRGNETICSSEEVRVQGRTEGKGREEGGRRERGGREGRAQGREGQRRGEGLAVGGGTKQNLHC